MNIKIPDIPPRHKSEVDGKIENMPSKTIPELQELLIRQDKLLKNRVFISKLKDKGEKIKLLHEKISQEISSRNEVDKASNLLANLNITDIEWKQNGKRDDHFEVLDSDDDSDEEDPLKIIAQSTQLKKTLIVLPKQKSLITEADINKDNSWIDEHSKYICKKTGKNDTKRTKFKPYKTTTSDVHDSSKEKLRPQGKYWEVTAATPPPFCHEPMQVLSLEESLNLQKQYTYQIKEIQAKHAAEKLATQMGYKIGEAPKSLLEYRNNQSDTESEKNDEHSEDEIHDDEDADKGGVVFTVMK